jgi:hypothetical protein
MRIRKVTSTTPTASTESMGVGTAETTLSDTATPGKHDSHEIASRIRRAVVDVDSIKVVETFGRELDDEYVGTRATIVQLGFQGRITLAPDYTLLAGYRWLAAAKKLGWSRVEASILGFE